MPQRRWILLIICTVVLLSGLAVAADWFVTIPADEKATYVGRQTCAKCHQPQHTAWAGSDHDLAMDLATPQTVLGNFDNQEISYFDVTTKMFRRDGKYFVNTEGPDGKPADFEVKYVIGVRPLQQYMVQFDDGRIQVLRECWDTQRKRWFYQSPPDVTDEKIEHDDPLHWTKRGSNFNHMCADCHTTNLRKNYDSDRDTYHTTWSEIDVSCETCHGPGSIHVKLAESKSLFWDRKRGYGLPTLKSDNSKFEIESCAKCHMLRHVVHPEFQPGGELLDYYAPSLLREGWYHADGQILAEDYVYGSFVQSKMYSKGIRCTDCHNPHTTRLKHEGNQVCTSCHQHPAGKYDVPAHHHHKIGTAGASCVECHMPSTYYMVVDPRRDHSLRVPRPDLSVALGTPNACTACHLDTSKSEKLKHYADWLAAANGGDAAAKAEIDRVDHDMAVAVDKWYEKKDDKKVDRLAQFARAETEFRRGNPQSEESLTAVLQNKETPAIMRATVIENLSAFNSPSSQQQILSALDDPDPLVRGMAAFALQPGRPGAVWQSRESPEGLVSTLAPLLRDPVRFVRTEAARVLAPYRGLLGKDDRGAFAAAIEEYVAGRSVEFDTPEGNVNVANVASDLGNYREAVRRYKKALQIYDDHDTARYNLARTYVQMGDNDAALEQFEILKKRAPDWAEIHRQIGLLLARMDRNEEAEKSLLEAAQLAPGDFDNLYTVGVFYLDQENWDAAERCAEALLQQFPQDPRAHALRRDAVQHRRPAD